MMDTPWADPAKRNSGEITAGRSDNILKPDIKYALAYLMVMKQSLDADKYKKFGEIMKDMRTGSIPPAQCVKMVKDLLQGYPELIPGFLDFVPKDLYKINLFPSEKQPDYNDALAFVCKLKRRFSGNGEKYKSFMNIMGMYLTDRKSAVEAYQEATVLFQDHPDLIQDFKHFMPNASRKLPPHHVLSMALLGHRDGGGYYNAHGVQGVKDKGKEKVN